MNPIVIIPARLRSTRLPEKPLADLGGKPMIVRVLECGLAANVGPVVVACDDPRIAKAVEKVGGRVCLTNPDLPSGTDRVSEAADMLDPEGHYDVVINLQGDSPTTKPQAIQTVLKALQDSKALVTTVAVKRHNMAEGQNPNICKIALTGSDQDPVRRALYFSRSLIPSGADHFYYHIGLYAYRRSALKQYVQTPVSVLEQTERLEQLRALEMGMSIGVALVDSVPQEVNTPEDLESVRAFFEARSKGVE